MKTPQIAVVMTTFNGDKYLVEQLESIISQTLRPSEIIVCDDGSSDDTIQILKRYSERKILVHHQNEQRLGVVKNFTKATTLVSTAEYIAFADQDDVWLPNKLEELVNKMLCSTDQAKPAMVFSDASIIDRSGHVLKSSLWKEFGIHPRRQTFRTLLTRNIVPGCMMLINSKMKELFLSIPEAAYMHDAWVTFLAFAYKNYAFVDEPLVKYRQHESNVTYSISSSSKSNLLSKIFEYLQGMMSDKSLLRKEATHAKVFFDMYSGIMSKEDAQFFEDFFRITNKNYLFKKLHLRHVNRIEGA